MIKIFSRANTSPFARWWWQIDRPLLLIFVLLMITGVILIGAAGPAVAMRIGVAPSHFIVRHIIFLVPAIITMVIVSMFDEVKIRRGATIVFVLGILGCMAAQFYGADIKGARRWVHFGPMSVQPSEFLKPAFFIVSAWLLSMRKEVSGYWGLIVSAGLWTFCVALLMIQPDLGMTFVISAVWGMQIFMAGLPIWVIFVMVPVFALGLVGIYFTFPHVTSRIDRFLSADAGDTYQVDKSLQAFANGGWFGEGPGQGTVIKHLPDAHADFIFSVAAEEMGLIAVWGIIMLYVALILRGMKQVKESKDIFITLAVIALVAQLGLQAIIHMGSSVHLLPTKGMTLPFLSYGGSSLISMGMVAGVILALTRRSQSDRRDARRLVADPSIPNKPMQDIEGAPS